MMNVSYNLLKIVVAFGMSAAFAVKMDHQTHDDLIDRLESTLSSISPHANERSAVMYRLAGLYADRARLKGMEEVEKNCNDCLGGKKDRQKAIQYFESTLKQQPKDKQGEVLVQLAHLEALNSKEKKALGIYKDILKVGTKSYSSRVVGLAHLNIAEDHFRKAEFKKALAEYRKAEKYDLPDHSLPRYRSAWCHLNMGEEKKAISTLKEMLKNPELVKDASFHQDISSDYATLMPRAFVGQGEIDEMLSLSPEAKRKENLKTLGEQASRLGKKGTAILAWQTYAQEPGFTKVEQIDIQIRLAQLQFDLGRTAEAQGEYRKALELWKTLGCKEEEQCKEIQGRYKNFVTSWNKIKKARPDKNLLQAYQDYLSVFSDDLDMTHWAALIARQIKDYNQGTSLFRRASVLAKEQKNAKMFEGSLLGEIELAEQSKNKSLIESAYTNYINVNPNGDKIWETRFARAALWAEQKRNTKEAFAEFYMIVTAKEKGSNAFKVQAADVGLDQLALLNDHESLEIRSQEFIKHVPSRKAQYLKVARKAVLNQVPVLAEKSVPQALAKLEKYPQDGASQDELIKFHKNRILLSQQIQDLAKIERAAQDLYRVKGLSKSDNEYVVGVLAWIAELKLDFKTAYNLHSKMIGKKPSADEEMKLAVLAELAGMNSQKHYENYLKKERDLKSRNAVRAHLIRKANNPWRELDKHLSELKKTPDVLARVVLESHGQKSNNSRVKSLLSSTRIGRFPEGQTLARQFEMDEIKKFDRTISRHNLIASSDRLLQTSIKKRLGLLDQADREVKKAIRSKDWSLKVITLAIAARENERLNKDILSLPAPRGLNKQQIAEYKQLLGNQAEIYRVKAANISEDINALFAQDPVLDGMERVLKTSSRPVRKILERELSMAQGLVRGSAKNRLSAMLKLPSEHPSFKEITVARNAVKEDPFNMNKVSKLQELEQQRGEGTMAGYLDARLVEMKKGAKL